MIESTLRPYLQKFFFDPLADSIARSRLHPNFVTLIAMCAGITAAIALTYGWLKLSIILLLLSGILDVLDGTIARKEGLSSNFGCVIDIVSDRIVEGSFLVALFFVDPLNRAAPIIWMFFSVFICVTSFLVVSFFLTKQKGGTKSFNYSPGLIERAEAFLFFVLMVLFPYYFSFIGYTFALLVSLTSLIRLYQFSQDPSTT